MKCSWAKYAWPTQIHLRSPKVPGNSLPPPNAHFLLPHQPLHPVRPLSCGRDPGAFVLSAADIQLLHCGRIRVAFIETIERMLENPSQHGRVILSLSLLLSLLISRLQCAMYGPDKAVRVLLPHVSKWQHTHKVHTHSPTTPWSQRQNIHVDIRNILNWLFLCLWPFGLGFQWWERHPACHGHGWEKSGSISWEWFISKWDQMRTAAAAAVDWEKQGCWFVSPLFHSGCPWQESKTMPLSNVSLRMLLKKFEAHKNAGFLCPLCFMLRISLLHFRQNRGKNGGW